MLSYPFVEFKTNTQFCTENTEFTLEPIDNTKQICKFLIVPGQKSDDLNFQILLRDNDKKTQTPILNSFFTSSLNTCVLQDLEGFIIPAFCDLILNFQVKDPACTVIVNYFVFKNMSKLGMGEEQEEGEEEEDEENEGDNADNNNQNNANDDDGV